MITDEMLSVGTTNDITALIARSGFPVGAFFLAEQLPQRIVASAEEKLDLLRFAHVSDLKLQVDQEGGIDPALYTTGRIFLPDFELRWSQDPEKGETQVVYLGTERRLAGLEPNKNLEKLKGELAKLTKNATPRQYYLFGEVLDSERLEQMGLASEQSKLTPNEGYYAELRVPRLLRYPVAFSAARKRRVQLTVCEYVEEETGRVQLFRFQDLKMAE